jgi:hypothetical protein
MMGTEIKVTDDYGKFSFMGCNRDVKSDKVLKSIKENGDFTKWKPILVTPGFKIIDGQHRFQACKELGLPIHYIVYDGDEDYDKVMRTLNIEVKVWQMEDWLTYYVKEGKESYMKMNDLMKSDYVGGLSNAIYIFSNGRTNSVDFKKGNLVDDSAYFQRMHEFLNGIEYKHRYYRPFVVAVLRFIERYQDQPKRVEKLRKKIGCVPLYHSAEQFMQAFENLR